MAVRIRFVGLVMFIVLCLGAGGLGTVVTTPEIETWYKTLAKPSWNPPDFVFGPVWTTLYVLMAIAAWLIWKPAGFTAANVVCCSTRSEHRLVMDFLWRTPTRVGIPGGSGPLADNHGHHRCIFPLLADRGVLDVAIPDMGRFRCRAELHDLADEWPLIGHHRTANRSLTGHIDLLQFANIGDRTWPDNLTAFPERPVIDERACTNVGSPAAEKHSA
jgi:hypothetical protein